MTTFIYFLHNCCKMSTFTIPQCFCPVCKVTIACVGMKCISLSFYLCRTMAFCKQVGSYWSSAESLCLGSNSNVCSQIALRSHFQRVWLGQKEKPLLSSVSRSYSETSTANLIWSRWRKFYLLCLKHHKITCNEWKPWQHSVFPETLYWVHIQDRFHFLKFLPS